MASYLVEAILLAALLLTSTHVIKMRRELVRLRTDQSDFAFVLGRTTEAVDDMIAMVRDFSADGRQLVNVLGEKIDEARGTIAELDAHGAQGRI
jgi:hypothetical protein